MENQEVTIYQKMQDPVKACETLGNWIAKSGMFNCEKIEQGQVLALTMMVEGKTPLHFAQKYHVMKGGKIAMRADYMLGEFNRIGGKHKILRRDSEGCSVELTLDGKSNVFTLLWDDVKNEPFAKNSDGKPSFNYSTPVKRMQMLWARVTSDGVRTVAPGILGGLCTAEELSDSDAPIKEIKLATVQPPAPQPEIKVVDVPPVVEAKPIEVVATPIEVIGQALSSARTVPATNISPAPATTPAPAQPSGDWVTDDMVEEVYNTLHGNFVKALKWFIREKWLTAPANEITTEDAAGIFIRDNCKTIQSVRVRKLLAKKEQFLKAINQQ